MDEMEMALIAEMDRLSAEPNVNLRALRAGWGVLGQLWLLSAAVEERVESMQLAQLTGGEVDLSDLEAVANDTDRRISAFLAGDYSEPEACPTKGTGFMVTPSNAVKRAEDRAKRAEDRAKRAENELRQARAPKGRVMVVSAQPGAKRQPSAGRKMSGFEKLALAAQGRADEVRAAERAARGRR